MLYLNLPNGPRGEGSDEVTCGFIVVVVVVVAHPFHMWPLPWRVVKLEKRILLFHGHIFTRQVGDHLYLFSNLNVYQFCLEELDYDNPPNDSCLKLHMLPVIPWHASDTRFERREKAWRTKHENVYRNHDRAIKHFLPTFSQTVSGCSEIWNTVCRTTAKPLNERASS